jgi:hypothetical protein
VSFISCLCLICYSIQLNIFIFFQEQGRRNDLFSKGVSPVPQDLMSTPGISKNINSDSVHCDPSSCVASGSRCHTADYLKDMKVVDSSLPCLSSGLLKSHTVTTNIKSDSVHCDPSSCMASVSRCHTADYLNVTNGVDASLPCLMYSHSKPPPPGSMCSPSPVQTPLSAHSVHLLLLLMLIVPLYFIVVFAVREKNARNRISTFEKWLSPPIR